VTADERIKAIRARRRIRRWEYRQRNLAHGAWGRFRIALALAREAYAIDDATADVLVADGFATDDHGTRLEPPRRIIWVTAERAATLGSRPLAMRLDADMLAARVLALVPFA
jgi:hypothetical protein